MLKILLDTNFFLVPVQMGIDIFEELDRVIGKSYKLVTIKPVVNELKEIKAKGWGKDQIATRVGMKFLEKVEVIDFSGIADNADEAIIQYGQANKRECAIATNDKELRAKLEELRVPVVYVKGKQTLGTTLLD